MFLASSLARCVLPTPVGPRKRKVPIGLFGSFRPTRLRWMLLTKVSIALSCPMTLDSKACRIPFSRTPSDWAMRCTGTPEIMDTTSSIWGASTVSRLSFNFSCHSFFRRSSCAVYWFSRSRKLAANSKFCKRMASFLCCWASSISRSCSSISLGTEMWVRWMREPASSSASMALSGKYRSVTYRSVRRTHASSASSVYTTLWCSSYLSLMFRRIWSVSSGVVGSTSTFWKRRSKAPSFSMFFRYSSSVVAPMHWISPRASAGFSMLAASMEPAAEPAPTMVWISSINRITSGFFLTSDKMARIRSSNSPRYLVPATTAVMSSDTIRFPNKVRDTFFLMMRSAKPSAMADFPTPGSPMRIGLFFLRRLRIWAIRSISFSRPTTGSSLPSSAAFVRSRPYLFRLGVSPSECLGGAVCVVWRSLEAPEAPSFLSGVFRRPMPSSSSSSLKSRPSVIASSGFRRSAILA